MIYMTHLKITLAKQVDKKKGSYEGESLSRYLHPEKMNKNGKLNGNLQLILLSHTCTLCANNRIKIETSLAILGTRHRKLEQHPEQI